MGGAVDGVVRLAVAGDEVGGGEGDGVAEDVQPQFLGVAVFVYRSGAVQDEQAVLFG